MSRTEVKSIVKRYAKKLEAHGYPIDAVYLFGSYAKGNPKKDSDIDVAVVSDKMKTNRENNYLKLWEARLDVDTRIEPHGFTILEFAGKSDPLVYEIKKHGVRIA